MLARVDQLKSRLTELEQQLQESKQEVGSTPAAGAGRRAQPLSLLQAEMERALLQGERQAEVEQLEAEADVIAQLQHRLDELEGAIQREKEQVGRIPTHTHTHKRVHAPPASSWLGDPTDGSPEESRCVFCSLCSSAVRWPPQPH